MSPFAVICYYLGCALVWAFITMVLIGLYRLLRHRGGQSPNVALTRVFLPACLLAVLIPAAPYAWVGANTLIFADQFLAVDRDGAWVDGPPEYIRVFYVTPQRAKVLFVDEINYDSHDGHPSSYRLASLRWYRRAEDGQWHASGNWVCLWSEMGSADDSTFPPYW